MRKFTPTEAVACALPSYDRATAGRLIAWLDRCGYQIVEKDQVSVAPPEPSEDQLPGEEGGSTPSGFDLAPRNSLG